MAGTCERRHATIAAAVVVGIAAVWWMMAATYTRTATIATTATYPSDEMNESTAEISSVTATLFDLNGYDLVLQVRERLAHQRGVSANRDMDRSSAPGTVTPTPVQAPVTAATLSSFSTQSIVSLEHVGNSI
ncbi:MAG: hypothetical protein ACOH2Q_19615 [Rhodococcus sp. (in: high G+C Gram-positive bacteria)]